MNKQIQLTAIIEPADDDEAGYVARCVELDIASEGGSVEDARRNLIEAVELFFEAASSEEMQRLIITKDESGVEARQTITVIVPLHNEVKRGTLASIIRQSGLNRELFEAK